jgi:uncharacterized protein YjbJ (UPF0337 family)
MVNTQMLEGRWNQVRGLLQKKWSQLTDDDLTFANGNVDQLVGRIQQRTGESREAIEQFLNEVTSQGARAFSQAAESAASFARDAAGQVRHGYNRIAGQFDRQYEMSQDFVRENPERALVMAFAAGALFGVVVSLVLRPRS